MNLLRTLRLWQRFVVLGLIGLVMCLVPLQKVVSYKKGEIAVAQAEANGLSPLRLSIDLQKALQRHRLLAGATLGGDSGAEDARVKVAADVEQRYTALLARLGELAYADALRETEASRGRWKSLAADVAERRVDAARSIEAHSALIGQNLSAMDAIADASGLSLDPVAESYYVMTAAVDHLPRLAETTALLRLEDAAVTGATAMSPARVLARSELDTAMYLRDRASAQLAKAIALKPELKDVLRTFKTADATDALFELTRAQLAGESAGKVSAADFAAQATAAIDLQYLFIDAASKGLENVLVTRVADTEAQLDSTLGLIGGLAIVAVLLGAALTRSVTGPLTSAVETANLIGDGKYDSVIDDSSNDEVGHLLKGLREVQDKLHRRAEEEKRWLAETEARAASERKLAEKIAEVVSQAGNGDLTQRVDVAGAEGFHADLCHSVNALLDAMTDLVRMVKDSSDAINTAAREIAAGNTDLSARTEEQASSLEETAASMEELSGAVRQNADSAHLANDVAIAASKVAEKGGQAVSEVVSTMHDISDSSRRIADIIAVIDGIAFQTNILALNAAVEAARAGEQGRGFAVVATEVRTLAQRSGSAAREIKALISDSVEKVQAGADLVHQAGVTMEEIVSSVNRVTNLMGEIAAASREQSGGIGQVNQAIVQMDDMTQQNAALVEEAAAAAESMQAQAEALFNSVTGYKV